MADLQRTVEIVFGAVNNTGSVIRDIESSLSPLTDGASAVVDKITGIATALSTVAIAFSTFAVTADSTWKESVQKINALSNGSAEALQGLSDVLIDYARNSTSTFEDIANAAYIAVSTGTSPEALSPVLAAAELLADASIGTLEEAVGLISRTKNAFGIELGELDNLVSDLFTIIQDGDTNITELANNLGNVAPTASAAAVPFELVGAAIAAMTASGVRLPETTTKLKSLLQELSTPSAELSDALGDVVFNGKNLPDVLDAIADATGGDLAAVDALFGSVEATEATLLLIGNAAERFRDVSAEMANNFGNVAQAAEVSADLVAKKFQNMKNNSMATVIEFGEELSPAAASILVGFSSVFNGLGGVIDDDEFSGLLKKVNDFGLDLGRKLDDIGEILPEAFGNVDLSGIVGAFDDLWDALEQAFDDVFGPGLDLTQVDDLTTFIQGLVNILETFVGVATGIINSMSPVFDALGTIAGEVGDVENDTAQVVGDILGKLSLIGEAGLALGAFLIAVDETDSEFTTVIGNIKSAADVLFNLLQAMAGSLLVYVTSVSGSIANVLATVTFGDLSDSFEASAILNKGVAEELKKGVEDDLDQAGQAWDKLLGKTSDSADGMESAADRVQRKVKEFADKSKENLSGVPDTVKDKTIDAIGDVDAAAKAAADASKNRLDIAKVEASTRQAEIKATAAITKTAIEKNAEINVQALKTESEKVKSILDGLRDSITSSAGVITGLVEAYSGTSSAFDQERLYTLIQKEYDLREDSITATTDLAKIEKDLAQARLDRINSGNGLITIQADGLEPELEAFMWRIIERVQVRAAEDQAEFLLGWGG